MNNRNTTTVLIVVIKPPKEPSIDITNVSILSGEAILEKKSESNITSSRPYKFFSEYLSIFFSKATFISGISVMKSDRLP